MCSLLFCVGQVTHKGFKMSGLAAFIPGLIGAHNPFLL